MDELAGGRDTDAARLRYRQRISERVHAEREGDLQLHFSSEEFIDTYLTPATPVGCRFHNDVTCLCDVDVSLTKGIRWEHAPVELLHVHDQVDLVVAAANIWLNLDVRSHFREGMGVEIGHVGGEKFQTLLSALQKGASLAEARVLVPGLTKEAHQLLRRLYGVSRQRKKLPIARIVELAEAGVTGMKAQAILAEETGIWYSLSSMSHARKRHGKVSACA